MVLAMATAVVATAAWLSPHPAGLGTHEALGLPPCGFWLVTGLPCPGCGLTTAFAHMARGQVVAATAANPAGVMLFLATVVALPLALWGLWQRVAVLHFVQALRLPWLVLLFGAVLALDWGARLLGLWLS